MANRGARTRIAVLLFFASSVVIRAAQGPRVDYFLDILTHHITPDSPDSPAEGSFLRSGSGGGSSHESPSPYKLQVALETLDPRSYRPGDPFVYEVLIENRGTRDVVIPWSPDRVLVQRATPDPSTALRGSLIIEVTDARQKVIALLESQPLYGTEALDETLITLKPGERARVRVPAVWRPLKHEAKQPSIVSQLVSFMFQRPWACTAWPPRAFRKPYRCSGKPIGVTALTYGCGCA